MSHTRGLKQRFAPATDGAIAVINLESARGQSWGRFWRTPHQTGIAEYLVDQEHMAAQFLGDMAALGRVEAVATRLAEIDTESPRAPLVHAKVASMTHRFAEARAFVAQAQQRGATLEMTYPLSLSIDQACGTGLDQILEVRRQTAKSGRLEDLVPLGALLADLEQFDQADAIYRRALHDYQNVSPFAMAWVCFQLGALWGEAVPEPQVSRAATWYERAIDYLPCYVKARVHLAELYCCSGRTAEAENILLPSVISGDPEASWRLADVLVASGRPLDASEHMQHAQSGFDHLLSKHLLAFADHGAEFFAGSGNNPVRAMELTRVNVQNRPTSQALRQAYRITSLFGHAASASELRGSGVVT